ncbi:hypothetical protein [Sporosarcina psychrophila]|uniref:hypothetical protein n=1 Tax=Sporosarcina psychrophila TaxID=1476 RepID=UPI00078BE6D3|nr:hypothetical protein [Sporosarcina psychrophila]AMQ07402.1 hypothetical protein AZE41_16470 [Sporosarcina psychrophila]
MKSRWSLLYAAIATTLLLTACGTSTDKEPENTNGSADVVENVDKETVTEGKEPDTEVDEVDEVQEDIMKNADLKESDEQSYAISVLPDFSLSSEEPGKDSLISADNEAVFMRIETVAKEDGTYDYLAENMIAVLEASGDGSAPIEVLDEKSIPTAEGIENAKVLAIKAETASITGIIFERDNMVVKLTIYDSPKEEYFEQFLRMAETIVTK